MNIFFPINQKIKFFQEKYLFEKKSLSDILLKYDLQRQQYLHVQCLNKPTKFKVNSGLYSCITISLTNGVHCIENVYEINPYVVHIPFFRQLHAIFIYHIRQQNEKLTNV